MLELDVALERLIVRGREEISWSTIARFCEPAILSIGGMTIALIMLFVTPCCYCLVKEWQFQSGKFPDSVA